MARVAVIGPAGSGKSFLINQLLGREAVKHEVSGYPVTMEISSGHHFVDESGQSIELVDTPGLCGNPGTLWTMWTSQDYVRKRIERDLTNRFDSLHMVVVVIARKRFEPTESSQIRSMLKFFNHKENPAKFLFLVNDRRDKTGDQETKEDDLRTCLRLLKVNNVNIVRPGGDVVNETFKSLAMTVSNMECHQFKGEVAQIKLILSSATTGKKNILSPKVLASPYKLLFWTAGAAAAAVFAFFLIKHFWSKSTPIDPKDMVEVIIDQAATNEVTADSLMTSDSSINKEMMCPKIEEMVCLESDYNNETIFDSEVSPEIPEALPTSEIDEEMMCPKIDPEICLKSDFNNETILISEVTPMREKSLLVHVIDFFYDLFSFE